MTRILCGSVLVMVMVVSAATLSRSADRSILVLPDTPYRYANVELPAHFTQPGRNPDNTPADNPLSDDGATLGRVLFYDTRLSANDTTSCGSCHVQAHAFADPKPSSTGSHGARTDRRAMPLMNLRYYERTRFFWDERAGNLEQMVLLPIQSRIEMGQDLKQVVATLARDPTYPVLFARAFGDRQITEQRIGKALAQFVRSIVSYQSRYDEGRSRAHSAQDDFGNFTLQENRGKALFMRNCSTCHMNDGNEHFFVEVPANTGLRGKDPIADGGVGDVTLRFADIGAFKSPSLRNVEVTAPYGHDGRFSTLDALIDHYSDNPILDSKLGYVTPRPLRFTTSEKAALIAFLKTLTDRACLTDARFSNPFVDRKDNDRTRVRHSPLTAGTILMTIGAAAAQSLVVYGSAVIVSAPPPLPSPRPVATPHPLIERLVSFDVNGDRRVSRRELPERMHGLVARGDANGDADLDSNEIRDLVIAVLPEPPRVPLLPRPPEGLPGVVRDLKLAPAKQAAALAIVRAHQLSRDVSGQTDRALDARLRTLLDAEEYENFVAAAARVSASPPIIQ